MAADKQKFIKHNLALPISLGVLLALFIGMAFIYFYVPGYVESKVLPGISKTAGIEKLECDVRRIGFTGLDLGGLYVGDSHETALSVESVRLDYSIGGLLRKHIDRVVISGVEFNCKFSNGELIIPGIDLQSLFEKHAGEEHATKDTEEDFRIPISVGSVKVRNAAIVCDYNGQTQRIPFELLFVAKEGCWDALECTVKLFPRDQELILSSKINLPEKVALLDINFDSLDLNRFDDVISLHADLKVSGNIESNCNFKSPQWRIDSSGNFFISVERFNGDGQFPLHALVPLSTDIEFSARYAQTGEWAFELTNESASRSASLSKDNKIKFNISGEGTKSRGNVAYTAGLDAVNIAQENATFKAPSISLTGNANMENNFTKGTADFALNISGADMSSAYVTMHIPELLLEGKTRYAKGGSVSVDGVMNFAGGVMLDSEHNVRISGIVARIPFKWPCEDMGERGDFAAEAIEWNNLSLGTVSGTTRQSGMGMAFEGYHESNLLSGLFLNFKGAAGYSTQGDFKAELDFNVQRFNSDSLDLGDFIPAAEGILFSGEFALDGNLLVDSAGNVKCAVNTILQDSRLELEEQGITIEGINFTLSMPDVLSMRSAPNQLFSFNRVSLGELTFNDGVIGLQIDSPETIFVENCEFKWCNGHVYTHAMRVPLYETDYDFTLYCDRLELASIFDQFGIARAEGSGSVNGRIPIKFTQGKLFINNGFLYSTPGEGGSVHLMDTDTFEMGIPENTPQFSQLDFTLEALKSFSYSWVTLSLNTEGEEMVLKMSLDGKPMKPLPFSYNSKLGTFTRIKAGSAAGINQPIKLDINFRLPVNKILYYGKGVSDAINIFK